MPLFATRRAFNAAKDEFTHNPSSLTRYVSAPSGTTPDHRHILSQSDWLAQVAAAATSGEILIFVHGFNTEQEDMLSRLGKIEAHMAASGWPGLV